jgi:beta-RFAP synthase
MIVQVHTGTRLHFGLIAPAAAYGRCFGGAGLMLRQPDLVVSVAAGDGWSAEGMHAQRVGQLLQRLRDRIGPWLDSVTGLRIRVERAPELHRGLGTGTQLALAVASGVLHWLAARQPQLKSHAESASRLAALTGRGARSGIGVHGFFQGGFLVDGGKPASAPRDSLPPLLARCTFPEHWPIILIQPHGSSTWHSAVEERAFAELSPVAEGFRDGQCRRILLELLPALLEGDYASFGEALYAYNRAAGEPFRRFQGGPYASSWAEAMIEHLCGLGVPATGQSSWGPTLFAIVADADRARWLLDRLAQTPLSRGCQFLATAAANAPATIHAIR